MTTAPSYKIDSGYRPGVIGRIAELHGTYYHTHWKFGLFFEAKVATELSEFLSRFDENRDGIWTARIDNRVEASIVIDGIHARAEGAHLRWFICSDVLRGKGVGRSLMDRAMKFCRTKGYQTVYLWTFEGLSAARHLYEEYGFKLVRQQHGEQWGTEVCEQYFELVFKQRRR